jgi:hypothetical protein
LSITLSLIEYLRSQGMSGDQIVEAIAAVETGRRDERWAYEAPTEDSVAEKRRAYDRLRKAEQRANKERVSTGLPPDIPPDNRDKERSPTPPKEITTNPLVEPYGSTSPQRTRRGKRLAADWKPSPEAWAYGLSLGFSEHQLGGELDQFRDYWCAVAGARGVKLDWDATWRNRLRDVAQRRGIAPSTGQSGGQGEGASVRAGEPAWDAWRTFYRDSGRKASIKLMDEAADAGKPFPVPSAWPPNRTAA